MVQSGLGVALVACTHGRKIPDPQAPSSIFGGLSALPSGSSSDLLLAAGLRHRVIATEGDRIFPDTTATFGGGADFTAVTPLGPDRALLLVNHEDGAGRLSDDAAWAFLGRPPVPDDLFAMMGISVIEVARGADGQWAVVPASPKSFRISGLGPATQVTGPALDILGPEVVGTICNCGGGKTPWGTVLTCEENFRYHVHEGLGTLDGRVGGGDPARCTHPHIPGERYGWVVEVDPADPEWKPRRHTALGRFRHESCAVVAVTGAPLRVYMADDRDGGCLWRYQSAGRYTVGMSRDEGTRLLEEGTLWVARFESGGGLWVKVGAETPLRPDLIEPAGALPIPPAVVARLAAKAPLSSLYTNQGAIEVDAAVAAWLVGGTGLGHPEGCVADVTGGVFVACTTKATLPAPFSADIGSETGAILHIRDAGGVFVWKVLSSPNEIWGNPDNLGFDADGALLVCTDTSTDSPSWGNDALFVVEGDSATRVVTAPPGAELSGPSLAPDAETLFLSVQHPDLAWGRSSVIAISRASP
jgi:secreted PhoX family phosphatase